MSSKNNDTDGCCGNPAKCAFTTASGRCKAREEFEQEQKPKKRKRQKFSDLIRATVPPEELRAVQESARADARRERAQGYDTGRTLSR